MIEQISQPYRSLLPPCVIKLSVAGEDSMSIFMDYEGITGESSDKHHKNWIDIEKIQWGTKRRITSATSTRNDRESSVTEISDLVLIKRMDTSSPALFIEACCGRGKDNVVIRLTKNGVRFISLFAFALALYVAETNDLVAEVDDPSQEEVELAREIMAKSMVALNQAMEVCREKRNAVLTPAMFDNLNLGKEDYRAALPYFYVRADNACFKSEAQDFLVAAHLLEYAGLKSELENGEKADYSALVMISFWKEIENKAVYLSLPEKKRQQLENIEALKQPFDLVKTAEKLGLF